MDTSKTFSNLKWYGSKRENSTSTNFYCLHIDGSTE
jgi:hypothetical protein